MCEIFMLLLQLGWADKKLMVLNSVHRYWQTSKDKFLSVDKTSSKYE